MDATGLSGIDNAFLPVKPIAQVVDATSLSGIDNSCLAFLS